MQSEHRWVQEAVITILSIQMHLFRFVHRPQIPPGIFFVLWIPLILLKSLISFGRKTKKAGKLIPQLKQRVAMHNSVTGQPREIHLTAHPSAVPTFTVSFASPRRRDSQSCILDHELWANNSAALWDWGQATLGSTKDVLRHSMLSMYLCSASQPWAEGWQGRERLWGCLALQGLQDPAPWRHAGSHLGTWLCSHICEAAASHLLFLLMQFCLAACIAPTAWKVIISTDGTTRPPGKVNAASAADSVFPRT